MMPGYRLSAYDEDKSVFFALGRNAMYAACLSMGLKAGDEILTPAFDCDGSLQPFRAMGLKLKFFRSDPYTFSVDMEDINKKLTQDTKLLHIINHFGMPQPWDDILKLRQKTGIPILEDNAYSLFSVFKGRPFGTFGDISIFSIRKNLAVIDGGMLCINNGKYRIDSPRKKARWIHPCEYPVFLRHMGSGTGLTVMLRGLARTFFGKYDVPPPLYSDGEKIYPDWPGRDVIGKEFSCDYLRPMSRLAGIQLGGFAPENYADIADKKRRYYKELASALEGLEGIKVLWPVLPEGAVPFCVSILIESKRDLFLAHLRKKYDCMAWPTLSMPVLERLEDFPDVKFLGTRLLQLNLPSDRVRSACFHAYLKDLIKDIRSLHGKYLYGT